MYTMYTQEQVFYYLKHVMQRAHVSICDLHKIAQSYAMEVPQPPKRLSFHTVDIEKRRTRLTIELTKNKHLLSLRITIHMCHNSDGLLYVSLTSAYAPDEAFDGLSSCASRRMDETLSRLADYITRRITAVDSLMWYFSQLDSWLDRARRGISVHRQHVVQQRLCCPSHHRFFSKIHELGLH